jgi:hypothetical protein
MYDVFGLAQNDVFGLAQNYNNTKTLSLSPPVMHTREERSNGKSGGLLCCLLSGHRCGSSPYPAFAPEWGF